ncbi:uncharacterized protein LOC115985508 [Quercus lobata]|uniref:uncharacterized protein LOC115985508 n=1 Tax=Quercus lobata TaxID=97700 RepID=UPI001244DF1F|nr:uncharacterized protein LOC115985508 [Quercus lobata]
MDPLKYLMEKLVQDGKTAEWVLLLSEFYIKYVTKKFVKGRAIAGHLVYCSLEEVEEIQGDLSDEDIMGIEVESWKILNFPATNNATEYEACIIGLQAALGLGVKELEVYGDLTLIISQEDNETGLLLDYYGSRLCGSCSKMPSMPSPWRSETYTAHAITNHDITLAILYMGNRHYWEDSPNNIQWP